VQERRSIGCASLPHQVFGVFEWVAVSLQSCTCRC
jgi:hypothetical protein